MIFIVGAGIMGLSVALEALARGIPTVVFDDPHIGSASDAAAAQLGMKGQRMAASEEYLVKLYGQRVYESWLAKWWPVDQPSCFRRGWGIDRLLNDSEFDEQWRRIWKHERDYAADLTGPPLFTGNSQLREIYSLQEASVDAPALNQALRKHLQTKGVEFLPADVTDPAQFEAAVARFGSPCSLVLAAGAASAAILESWCGQWPHHLLLPTPRYSLGATVVLQKEDSIRPRHGTRPLDLDNYVMESFIKRSERRLLTVTRSLHEVRLTALNLDWQGPISLDDLRSLRMQNETDARFAKPIIDLRRIMAEHGFEISERFDLRVGIRCRWGSQDLVLGRFGGLEAALHGRVPFGQMQKMPRVILFTGANRSGYVYGPALAPRVIDLHAGKSA